MSSNTFYADYKPKIRRQMLNTLFSNADLNGLFLFHEFGFKLLSRSQAF